MIEIKTNFLAKDWLKILENEVKPIFPDIDFTTYLPEKKTGKRRRRRIMISMSDKAAFVYNLRGAETTPKAVINSLRRYVFIKTNKLMTEEPNDTDTTKSIQDVR